MEIGIAIFKSRHGSPRACVILHSGLPCRNKAPLSWPIYPRLDFNRPYAHQSSADNLLNYAAQGGFMPAVQNLFWAGNPLVQEIATHWGEWRDGVPQR